MNEVCANSWRNIANKLSSTSCTMPLKFKLRPNVTVCCFIFSSPRQLHTLDCEETILVCVHWHARHAAEKSVWVSDAVYIVRTQAPGVFYSRRTTESTGQSDTGDARRRAIQQDALNQRDMATSLVITPALVAWDTAHGSSTVQLLPSFLVRRCGLRMGKYRGNFYSGRECVYGLKVSPW